MGKHVSRIARVADCACREETCRLRLNSSLQMLAEGYSTSCAMWGRSRALLYIVATCQRSFARRTDECGKFGMSCGLRLLKVQKRLQLYHSRGCVRGANAVQ